MTNKIINVIAIHMMFQKGKICQIPIYGKDKKPSKE